jgi:glycosyltransferase involved in cell wall biosynthesis
MTSRPVLAILAPGLIDRIGHEHEYTLMVAEAALAKGVGVEILCPPLAEDLGLPGVLLPILPSVAKPPRPGAFGARLRARMAPLADRLSRARYRRVFARHGEANWLLHTAPYPEIAQITSAFAAAGKGRLAVILRYDHHDDPAAIQAVRAALAPAADPRISLFADSETLRILLAPLAPTEIRLAPVPVHEVPRRVAKSRTVGFFGSMRKQKGFQHLPALFAAATAIDPTLSFVVQAYRHPHDALDPDIEAALAALRHAPDVRLLESPLSSEEFHAGLADCAVLVTPYDERVYRAGTSGVFAAGLAAGCAVLGTPRGWMRDEAERAGLTRFLSADFSDVGTAAQALVEAASLGARPFAPTPAEARWIAFNSARSLVERLGA